jgi:Cytochrome P460
MLTALIKLCLLVAATIALFAREVPDPIPYPEDYRTWAHVKTVLVGPQSSSFATEAGFHHIYANDKAMVGYRTGTFPEGSIVVYDLVETKEVAGNTIEGPQRRFDMMFKDRARSRDASGWRFARFKDGNRTDGTLAPEAEARCLACHSKNKEHDSVFSQFRK